MHKDGGVHLAEFDKTFISVSALVNVSGQEGRGGGGPWQWAKRVEEERKPWQQAKSAEEEREPWQ